MSPVFLLRLTLPCKLINPEPIDPDNTLADRVRSRGDNMKEFARRLSPAEQVLQLFPESLAGHVQVMVEILPTSKAVPCPVN
jgi:hypothetical protein